MIQKTYRERKTIGSAILTERRPPKEKIRPPFVLLDRRIAELTALAQHRGPGSDISWVRPFLDHISAARIAAGSDHFPEDFADEIVAIAPWLIERYDEIVASACRSIQSFSKWSASRLGAALALSIEERHKLGIRTIRSAGMTVTDQRAAKRDRDRQRQERKRRENNAVTRETYIANSIAAQARREGVSERTIRRRRARALANGSDACPMSVAHIVHFNIGEQPRTFAASETVAKLYAHAATLLAKPRDAA